MANESLNVRGLQAPFVRQVFVIVKEYSLSPQGPNVTAITLFQTIQIATVLYNAGLECIEIEIGKWHMITKITCLLGLF